MQLTEEQKAARIDFIKEVLSSIPSDDKSGVVEKTVDALQIALASLTAEPFAVVTKNEGEVTVELLNGCADGEYDLFTAPPAPALRLPERVTAQDMRESLNIPMHEDEAQAAANGFNQALLEVSHLNAAAPQSVPVNDDTKRMDWLVSKTVNVREPQRYGSRDLFWSQATTDEEDEHHATLLREQIDAAMKAEE